ncbi:fimbria/pilus periplasmic chaperone [Enterobacter roggenkampii]|uniref:fimbrial biogenesis chaperone n=1 Tax=Enterobacter roggenkampii TaxID=1812935 RepID=UPI0022375549|nr:fimbria/pilus periplasmic chaperone [Enterobacter roggenkampii]MCW5004353.1 fimbria/pilus periplasmic chaperone [Enterobacter roggenkampii]
MKIIAFIFTLISLSCSAGIGLDRTRMILYDDTSLNKGITLLTEKGSRILVSAQVVDEKDNIVKKFNIIPNVFLAEGTGEYKIRILPKSTEQKTPHEELYYLKITTIPESISSDTVNNLSYSLGMKIKLFYRPKLLSAIEQNYNLPVTISDGVLFLKNVSPFHLTIRDLKVDGHLYNLKNNTYLIKPFAQLELKQDKTPHLLEYSVIDDDGIVLNKMVKL